MFQTKPFLLKNKSLPFPHLSIPTFSQLPPALSRRLRSTSSEVRNVGPGYATHNGADRAHVSCMRVVFPNSARGFRVTDMKSALHKGVSGFKRGSLVLFRMSASSLNTYLMLSSLLPPSLDTMHTHRANFAAQETLQHIQMMSV